MLCSTKVKTQCDNVMLLVYCTVHWHMLKLDTFKYSLPLVKLAMQDVQKIPETLSYFKMGFNGRSIQLDNHFLYPNFSCANFTLFIIQDAAARYYACI